LLLFRRREADLALDVEGLQFRSEERKGVVIKLRPRRMPAISIKPNGACIANRKEMGGGD
jgi:hypothetical protein